MKVGLIQMRARVSKEESLRIAEEYIASAAQSGADVVMLPEMFNCPYSIMNFANYAEPAGGETWTRMSDAARRNWVYLIAGSMPELVSGTTMPGILPGPGTAAGTPMMDWVERLYNTSFVFDRNGKEIAKHRKMHLFDIDVEGGQYFRESASLSAGNEVTMFDTEFGRFGLMICYDIRFPELSRLMADREAVMLFVPACFNMTTGPAHWELLFRGRALDNQVFMAGCAQARRPEALRPAQNAKGSSSKDLPPAHVLKTDLSEQDSSEYISYGHSIITSPWGDVIAQMDEREGVLVQEIDLTNVYKVRNELPLLRQRRTDVYSLKNLTEKGDGQKKENDMENGIHYTGFRYSTTGAFGYDFYEDREKKCSVSCLVIPSPPVYIRGFGKGWESEFDTESTIVPGLTRTVIDAQTGEKIAAITYKAYGAFEINKSIDVYCFDEGYYVFYRDGVPVGKIKRFEGSCSWFPDKNDMDVEPYWDVVTAQNLSPGQRMLIAAFPLLRFAM